MSRPLQTPVTLPTGYQTMTATMKFNAEPRGADFNAIFVVCQTCWSLVLMSGTSGHTSWHSKNAGTAVKGTAPA